MKPLAELTKTDEPFIATLEAWITDWGGDVRLHAPDPARADENLLRLQVTRRSPLGAQVHDTGGIEIDHGWLRLFGSTADGPLPDIMELAARLGLTADSGALLIGADVIGGLFAINGGGLPDAEQGEVCCFAPDTNAWEPMGLKHSGFLDAVLSGALEKFYEAFRWSSWQTEIAALPPDRVVTFYPPPGTAEFGAETSSRRAVPFAEIWPENAFRPGVPPA